MLLGSLHYVVKGDFFWSLLIEMFGLALSPKLAANFFMPATRARHFPSKFAPSA